MKLGVIGLGKLGLPYAALLANHGHSVLTWDEDEDARRVVDTGAYAGDEPETKDLLAAAHWRGSIKNATSRVIAEQADVAFIVVPTPSQDDGSFSDEHVRRAVGALVNEMEPAKRLTICVVSTVSPGTSRQLQELAGSAADIVYSPSFIALGDIVRNLRRPDVILVGRDDPRAGGQVVRALKSIADGRHHDNVRCTDLVTAEIAKIGLNAYITTKIAFANTLGTVCERWGANVDDATDIIGSDSRVGKKYFTAGAGFGGPCFPRDNRAFAHAASGLPSLSLHVDNLNDGHALYAAQLALKEKSGARTFSVIGLEYKEGTSYSFDSFGVKISDAFVTAGLAPADPRDADVVVIALPLKDTKISGFKPDACVVDLWRTHRYLADADVRYIPFGG